MLLENPLHPTLQLGKLGQNGEYYLSHATESISASSREAEMEKNGVELTILLVVRVVVPISKADWNSGRKASPGAGEQKAAGHDDVIHL